MNFSFSRSRLTPRRLAFAVGVLIVWCALWETVGAPLRSIGASGYWMALKGLLLLPLLPRLWRGERRALQILSMLILLYAAEGWVRAFSDWSALGRGFAWGEIGLSTAIFVATLILARRARYARELAAADSINPPVAAPPRPSRPDGMTQLRLYGYMTWLVLFFMSFVYTRDGTESAHFYQGLWLLRGGFIALNLGLLARMVWRVQQRKGTP